MSSENLSILHQYIAYMIARLGLIVAASIAVYVLTQVTFKSSRPESTEQPEPSANDDEFSDNSCDEGESEDKMHISGLEDVVANEEEEIEDEQVVKQIHGVISPLSVLPHLEEEDVLLPESENHLPGRIDFISPTNKHDTSETSMTEKGKNCESNMDKTTYEVEHLRNLVRELEEREMKLKHELLECHGLKERESGFFELEKQLKIKTIEIVMLKGTVNTLQADRKKLQDEVFHGASAKKELENARKKIKELHRQIQLESNRTKHQLLLLKQQVIGLQAKEEEAFQKDAEVERKLNAVKEMEVEVVELKRENKELQHERRELMVKLDAAEANVKALSNLTEKGMVAQVREEANAVRQKNEDLVKQIEGLQMNRFSEVEELVYLRWVNACLRFELRNFQTPSGKISAARDLSRSLSPRSRERAKQLMLEYAVSERGESGDTDFGSNFDNASVDSDDLDNTSSDSRFSNLSTKKPRLIKKLKIWGKSKDDSSMLSSPVNSLYASPRRVCMSNQRPKGPLEALMLRNAGDDASVTSFGTAENEDDANSCVTSKTSKVLSDGRLNSVSASFHLMSKSVEGVLEEKYPAYTDRHKLALEGDNHINEKAQQARAVANSSNRTLTLLPQLDRNKENPISHTELKEILNESDSQIVGKMQLAQIEKRPLRTPKPPPKPDNSGVGHETTATRPSRGPPLPPPLGSGLSKAGGDRVHKAPELVESYQSLMKHEGKNDNAPSICNNMDKASDARSNMIGETENRSSFLLAVKADVETQGEFVMSLANEVRAASFTNADNLVEFVNWLDDELSFLVDERAVLKHFDWPEGKTDALREASFEYQQLAKLEKQVSSFNDDPNLNCKAALEKMFKLLEKVEQSVYALLRTRDIVVSRYREFGIHIDWLLDSGLVGKIKLGSVKLARNYMKRVLFELDARNEQEKEPKKEFLILQGVRFAFRVHQFAGGFDAESMEAFEELRIRASKATQNIKEKINKVGE